MVWWSMYTIFSLNLVLIQTRFDWKEEKCNTLKACISPSILYFYNTDLGVNDPSKGVALTGR